MSSVPTIPPSPFVLENTVWYSRVQQLLEARDEKTMVECTQRLLEVTRANGCADEDVMQGVAQARSDIGNVPTINGRPGGRRDPLITRPPEPPPPADSVVIEAPGPNADSVPGTVVVVVVSPPIIVQAGAFSCGKARVVAGARAPRVKSKLAASAGKPAAVPAKDENRKGARGAKNQSTFAPVGESGFDLMFKVFAPLVWLVELLIPEGTVLIVGKPKSGKSWFVLNVLLSCVLAINFLNRAVTKCGALYLALEDNERRMRSRLEILLRLYGDNMEALRAFEFRTEWPRGAMGAAALDEYLTANPHVRVVAIDVLKRIRPEADARRNAYDLDYEAIQPWKAVADAHRITLLLVHHSRKAEADDVFDEVSGTLGINGVVDQMIVLRRLPNDPKSATLHARGRDLPEDHELGIELRDGWWEFVGEAKMIAANDTRKQVLEVLEEADHPLTTAEVMQATGKRSRPSTSRLLAKMVDDGLIAKEGKGYRTIPLSL